MTFKVEIEMNGLVFRDSYFAKDLQELTDKIKLAFPKGKIVSIVGG